MQLRGPSSAGLMYSDTGGDGPAVVLLHGVLMGGSLWDGVVNRLRDRYRCIVPELPFGAHRTPMPDGADLTLGSLARMISDFLIELDLHDVTLVCNDWGGAQLVIAPGGSKRVANLVLVSCEAFDNYPPGLPGRLLCLNASLPGGTFITSQLLRPRLLRHLPVTFGSLSKRRVPNEQFMSWMEPLRRDRRIRRDFDKYARSVPKKKQLLEWADEQRASSAATIRSSRPDSRRAVTSPRRNRVLRPTLAPSRTDSTNDRHSYTLSPLQRRVVFTNTPQQHRQHLTPSTICRPYKSPPEHRPATQNPTSADMA